MPQEWLHRLIGSPAVGLIAAGLEDSALASRPQRVSAAVSCLGSWGSSANLIAGSLAARMNRAVLLVVAHLDDADDAAEDLELFAAAGRLLDVVRFGALEVLPGETNVSLELLAERLAVVEKLVRKDAKPQATHDAHRQSSSTSPLVVVASIQSLMQAVPEPAALPEFSKTLEAGVSFPPGELLDWLDRAGYTRADAIEQPGDFTTRGGIVDIFLPSSSATETEPLPTKRRAGEPGALEPEPIATGPIPVRIDFFGDEIDSIHVIDTDTMGSGRRLKRVQLVGASMQRLQSDDRTTNLLNLLPGNTVVVLHEVLEIAEQARGYYERLTNARGIYAPNDLIKRLLARASVEINQYSGATGGAKSDAIQLPVRQLPPFATDAAEAVKELAALEGDVVALCGKPAERQRLSELLAEHAPDRKEHVALDVGYLHRGFVWDESDPALQSPGTPVPGSSPLQIVPHHELFHRYETRRRIRRISVGAAGGGKSSDAFLDLDVGDYVVHVDHGIARFVGFKTMKQKGADGKVGSTVEDYLTLEFANHALLHVPATQIELIQKYIGGFEGKPPLSLLGGKRWGKQKESAAESVKQMAAEMLRIQAARASLPGIRYPADTPWQREFEAEFPYDETDDQLAAIVEVKKDMHDEQPMDRLICGDVGFGKTEVAMRAAFKAAEYGKQVAVLVPTTVLAEQHERTFKERMRDYPFRVESLSRFRTGTEVATTLKALEHGEVDIVIGTHRLLSNDVKFSDLGLVVIDEEQRFGVEHKHKLLSFRLTVDVLTLSATPIPRTLHMAMLGLRDISSLSTPPVDRRAVVTEVIPYDKTRVQRAIVRELARDGQVFFVHNRVYNIHEVADELRKLVPEARIVVGHGQMPGHELEAVMLKFMRREADILVCTTIIESGIDIPTANTIFINEADIYGLADLHQLRGRVGRYKHRAYCYLLLPEDRPLAEKAQKRLKALEQYSMLGAGFKIAMRDLEIRGAGNLLGAEQSGHIAAVGYQMYCILLEQEAKRLKHEKVIEPMKTHLELPITGRIPPAYIASAKYRMEAYRRLSRAATLDELAKVVSDLTDAYGEPPKETQALIDLTELRIAASTLDVERIKLEGPDLIFRTPTPQRLDEIFKSAPGRTSLIDDRTVYYRPPPNYLEPPTLLAVLRKLLVRPLRDAAKPEEASTQAGL